MQKITENIDLERTEKIRAIYEKAFQYLSEITPSLIQHGGLEEYFDIKKSFKTKNDILFMLLSSLQNRQMAANVIGFQNQNRSQNFKNIFFEYDCELILNTYTPETLFERFQKDFQINNAQSKSNLWKVYSKSVISACKFISTFKDAKDFDDFIESFRYNQLSLAAVPMLLEKEIFGLGFALACDFLKELGYTAYTKPDVHIKDIFHKLDLCENEDFSAYKAVVEMARAVDETPYKVDKIFWLIGSGRYYRHDENIGSHKAEFLEIMVKDV